MKVVLSLALLAAPLITAAPDAAKEFEAFKAKFGRKVSCVNLLFFVNLLYSVPRSLQYADEAEAEKRFELFSSNLEKIEELNELMAVERDGALRERQERKQRLVQSQAKTAEAKESKLTVAELKRATQMMTKAETLENSTMMGRGEP